MRHIFISVKKTGPLMFLIFGSFFNGQVRIGNSAANTSAPNSSAFIDASSNPTFNNESKPNIGKGLLFPRTDLTKFTAFSPTAPEVLGTVENYYNYYDGFIVFNTASSGVAAIGGTEGTLCRGFWYYDNDVANDTESTAPANQNKLNLGTWRPMRPDQCSTTPPIVTTLDCASGTFNPSILAQGTSVTGGTLTIPYTGGNGAGYPAETVTVNGLTFSRTSGTLNVSNGTLTYSINGTPSASGPMNVHVTLGDKSCDATITVTGTTPPIVTTLDCGNATFNPSTLTQGSSVTGGTLTIPYTGGNGAGYPVETVTVNGLTFSRAAGTLNTGNGTLTYSINGTPSTSGSMNVHVTLGDKSCDANIIVINGQQITMCDGRTWKTHNLGANESLDPNVPVAGIHGDKYQWGRINPILTQSQDQANAGPVTWNFNDASDGSWGPSRTSNDPCPPGFRVPTQAEWQALNSCSSVGRIGPFGDDASLFSSALTYTSGSNKLTFPAAGFRSHLSIPNNPTLGGVLQMRNEVGMYWSSTSYYTTQNNPAAYSFGFNSSSVNPSSSAGYRIEGHSVRCIAE
ncbi:FISUMP domain-containing protein [Chryseobacterium potabilaquae]|uniref:Uncharacterized protein n=1 Tax=Chryseobacterium potabilaquae TaxID=2675057 RepID=A0A6N4X666_9FLAO|nr:FISUMP domain-containing protein [Chryseobacterium potabilaquae]CAA7196520.1 hypothetical protein CHRY9293_02603 [Chryseobacterium potabilaquae]